MALNPSGVMSIGGSVVGQSINLELGLAANANSSIGQTNFRELAKVLTGAISLSDFYGKSNVTTININANHSQYTLSPAVVPGYVAGETKVQLNIGEDVYLFSTDTNAPALLVEGFVSGDQVTIVNDGYIIGMGGEGGLGRVSRVPKGQPGGPGISLAFPVTIENNRYIAGGGGGGGAGVGPNSSGGGGAGGGEGGSATGVKPGGAGGAPGMPGQDGPGEGINQLNGGGGGRILPGLGGAGGTYDIHYGRGGGAGGGGSYGEDEPDYSNGGAGGSANYPGEGIDFLSGSGGGGWGASGGYAYWYPGAGGKAVKLNGNTATLSGPGFYYGAVS